MRRKVRGVTYHVEVSGQGPSVVFLHGFTGTAATWHSITRMLSREYRTISIDLLGHGRSDAPENPKRYSFAESVADLAALTDELGLRRFHLVGYSMGGRLALHAALAMPERLASLVLISSSPGIKDPAERAARRRSDAQLADFLLREGVESFVDRWERLPLFATEQRLPRAVREAVRAERLSQRATGLAGSLLGAGAGMQEPLFEALETLQVPTLVVAGELDEKYKALAYETVERLPQGRAVVLADAGHAVHRERPELLAKTLLEHLEDVERKMIR